MRKTRKPDFGIPHCRCTVAIARTEITLSINQRVTQRKILRHAHHGVVSRLVTVRVVFAQHVADDAGADAGLAPGSDSMPLGMKYTPAASSRISSAIGVTNDRRRLSNIFQRLMARSG